MNKKELIALVAIEVVLFVLAILKINLKFIDTQAIMIAIPAVIWYFHYEDSKQQKDC